jgi:hypothetical protein
LLARPIDPPRDRWQADRHTQPDIALGCVSPGCFDFEISVDDPARPGDVLGQNGSMCLAAGAVALLYVALERGLLYCHRR